jgi:hypothetical protein
MVTTVATTHSTKPRDETGPHVCAKALDWLHSLPDAHYFTEREYCEAAFEFANARTANKQFRAILAICNDHAWTDAPVYLSDEAREAHAAGMEKLRLQFTERLLRVMGHRGLGRRELAREVRAEGDRVLITERTRITEGGYRIARRVQALRPSEGLSHALLVLINPAYAEYGGCLGDELCRCKLARCEKFFFARHEAKSGPPMREYCCLDHRIEARKLDGAIRVRRHRENLKRARKAGSTK